MKTYSRSSLRPAHRTDAELAELAAKLHAWQARRLTRRYLSRTALVRASTSAPLPARNDFIARSERPYTQDKRWFESNPVPPSTT